MAERRMIGIVDAPSSAGAFAPGQEKAPAALRKAGLTEQLKRAGVDSVDIGSIPLVRWRPDPAHPFAQNADLVLGSIQAVALLVREAIAADTIPLVLGGDCTLEIGTVMGFGPDLSRIGLLYFDAHPDLNRPVGPGPGALDWTGLAHLLGEPETVEAIAQVGDGAPMLQPNQVVLFARDPSQHTEREVEAIARLGLRGNTCLEVARDPETTAREAMVLFGPEIQTVLIHFDVDTIDFTDLPISHHGGRNEGLGFDETMRALGALLSDPRIGAITISELNPDHADTEGSVLRRFVERLADALGNIPQRPG